MQLLTKQCVDLQSEFFSIHRDRAYPGRDFLATAPVVFGRIERDLKRESRRAVGLDVAELMDFVSRTEEKRDELLRFDPRVSTLLLNAKNMAGSLMNTLRMGPFVTVGEEYNKYDPEKELLIHRTLLDRSRSGQIGAVLRQGYIILNSKGEKEVLRRAEVDVCA